MHRPPEFVTYHILPRNSLVSLCQGHISWGQRNRVVTTIFCKEHFFAYFDVSCGYTYPAKNCILESLNLPLKINICPTVVSGKHGYAEVKELQPFCTKSSSSTNEMFIVQ